MHPGYFEGIIQLRNDKEEVILFIRNTAQNKQQDMISKEKRVANGFDFYIKKKSFLRFIASEIQSRYGGEVVFSDRLMGVNKMTSRLIYRESVVITLPDLLKNDLVSYKGDVFLVHSVNKTKANLTNLKTSHRLIVDYTKTKLKKIEERYKTNVTKTHPRLEVLHPLNFESVPVVNPEKLPIGKNVKVVIFDDEVFLV